MKNLFITFVLAASGCVGDLETSCHVGGMLAGGSSCTFTNKGLLPARSCVNVSLKKTHDSPPNPFLDNSDAAPVGSISRSTSVCSGTVWGSSTSTIEIGYFDPNPMKMCGGWDNCEMSIIASND
jgi:hypothetical protein